MMLGFPLCVTAVWLMTAAAAEPLSPPPRVAVSPAPQQTLQSIFDLITRKHWQEALKQTQEQLKSHPEDPQLLLFQVTALQGMGMYAECQIIARQFLAKYPDSPNRDQALYFMATSLHQASATAEASAALEEASRVTQDESLKRRIAAILGGLPPEPKIGIRLGGKPPSDRTEVEAAAQVSQRILQRALEDYRRTNGNYPASLEDLLQGAPPILRRLPEDPNHPGRSFEYRVEGGKYVLPSAPQG